MAQLGMPTSIKFSLGGGGAYQRKGHNCEVLSWDVLCSSECRLIEVVTHAPPTTSDGAVARRLGGANQRDGMGSDLHMLWGLSFISSPAML